MGMNINTGINIGDNYQYKTINKNSAQYVEASLQKAQSEYGTIIVKR